MYKHEINCKYNMNFAICRGGHARWQKNVLFT